MGAAFLGEQEAGGGDDRLDAGRTRRQFGLRLRLNRLLGAEAALLLGGSRTACVLGARPSQLFAEEALDEFRALVRSVRTRWEMP